MRRSIPALCAIVLSLVAQPALADWNIVYDPEAVRTLQGNRGGGNFETREKCEAYRATSSIYEQKHSWCEGFDGPAQSQDSSPRPTRVQDPAPIGDADYLVSFDRPIWGGRRGRNETVRPPSPTPVPPPRLVSAPPPASLPRLSAAQCDQKYEEAQAAIHGKGLEYAATVLRASIPVCAGAPTYLRQRQLMAELEAEFAARKKRAAYPHQSRGLIGGTTWDFGRYYKDARPNLPAEKRKTENSRYALRLSSWDISPDKIEILNSYDFVFGMAIPQNFLFMISENTHASFDLFKRVRYDSGQSGGYSAQNFQEYSNLKGRSFDLLDCHSNGAMICLYALLRGDITAKKVRLFGPQLTEQSISAWRILLDPSGFGNKIPELEVYISDRDPVPYGSLNLEDGGWRDGRTHSFDESIADHLRPASLDPFASLSAEGCYMDQLRGCFKKPSPKVISVYCPSDKGRLSCHDFVNYNKMLPESER